MLLAGTNNVGAAAAATTRESRRSRAGSRRSSTSAGRRRPSATIILTAIFPRNDNMAVMPTITRINQQLAALADGKRIRFLNVNDRLADTDGRLFAGMMNERDKLHPTLAGYQVWADALKPLLRELLGPPQATDDAPPPTGDPSAASRPR